MTPMPEAALLVVVSCAGIRKLVWVMPQTPVGWCCMLFVAACLVCLFFFTLHCFILSFDPSHVFPGYLFSVTFRSFSFSFSYLFDFPPRFFLSFCCVLVFSFFFLAFVFLSLLFFLLSPLQVVWCSGVCMFPLLCD